MENDVITALKIDQGIKGAIAQIMPLIEISGNDCLKREIKRILWRTADFIKGEKCEFVGTGDYDEVFF